METTEQLVGWVYEGKLGKLERSISTMNRKAAKLGCKPLVLTVTSEEKFERLDPSDRLSPNIRYVKVMLDGTTPKLSDWEFVAACDHDPNLGQTVKVVPSKQLPEQYRENNSHCEHCNSNRQRKSTYIVENTKTGEFKRVGSTCIKDFLGHQAAEMFLFRASYMSMMVSLDDEYGYDGSGGHTSYFSLPLVLAYTVKCVKAYGYTSKTKSREEGGMSTAEDVCDQLMPSPSHADKVFPITEEDLAAVQPMIEWAKTLDEKNDYYYNLVKLANAGVTTFALMGFAVSIVPTYRRVMDQIEQKAKKKPSEWVGQVDDKVTLPLRHTRSFTAPGYTYNSTSYFHKFEDAEGNFYSWSTSVNLDSTQTCWYTVRATIKKHSEFKDIKTTDITRCKLEPSMAPFWTIEKKEN